MVTEVVKFRTRDAKKFTNITDAEHWEEVLNLADNIKNVVYLGSSESQIAQEISVWLMNHYKMEKL